MQRIRQRLSRKVSREMTSGSFWFAAKPIEKAPEPDKQRLAIQDDFGIDHKGLFVSPLGVWSSLIFKTQLFLLFHPVLRSCKCFKPVRSPKGLVKRDLLTIGNVSQLDCSADF